MAAPDSLFSTIWDGYNNSLSLGVASGISTALSTAAGILQGCMALYVIITGVLVVMGALSFGMGMRRCIRALLIVAILVPANYSTYVTTMFTQTIPNIISSAIGGRTNSSGAEVFDQLLASDEAMLAQVLATSGGSVFNIGKIISAYLAMGLAEIGLLVSFLIWFMAYALTYVVVAVGPYVIPFWLFDTTRSIPERLFGKLIGYMLLMVMVLSLTQIVQSQEKTYVSGYAMTMTGTPNTSITGNAGYVTADGNWIPAAALDPSLAGTGIGNLDEQVSVMWKVAMAFGFGAALMVLLPSMAAYIGGGVAIQITPIISTALRLARGGV